MFDIPNATNFLEFPYSNGGAFLLSGAAEVGNWDFVESILSGEEV